MGCPHALLLEGKDVLGGVSGGSLGKKAREVAAPCYADNAPILTNQQRPVRKSHVYGRAFSRKEENLPSFGAKISRNIFDLFRTLYIRYHYYQYACGVDLTTVIRLMYLLNLYLCKH